jgi:hypothetical protein
MLGQERLSTCLLAGTTCLMGRQHQAGTWKKQNESRRYSLIESGQRKSPAQVGLERGGESKRRKFSGDPEWF